MITGHMITDQLLLSYYSYQQWMDVVQCMNVLDVLVSLTSYTMTNEGIMCRPQVISPADSEQVTTTYCLLVGIV